MPDQFSNNKKKCLYCGNNQTSHPMTWFESTLAVVMSRTSERTLASPFWQSCFVFAEKLLLIFMRVLVFLRVVSFSDDIAKAPIRRGQVLWEEARRRGIEMQNMRFLGRPTDIFRYKKNNHWEYFNGLPRVGRDNPALAWIAKRRLFPPDPPPTPPPSPCQWRWRFG